MHAPRVILGTVAASTSGWAASARIPTSAGRGSGTQGQAVQVDFFIEKNHACSCFLYQVFISCVRGVLLDYLSCDKRNGGRREFIAFCSQTQMRK